MTCIEVQTWILTDETPQRASAEVRAHVRICAHCRGTYRTLVRIIHEVETAPLPPIPFAAREKLLASLEPRHQNTNGLTAKPPTAAPTPTGADDGVTNQTPGPNAKPDTKPIRLFEITGTALGSLTRLGKGRRWLRWTATAAAALLCVVLGMALNEWLRKPPNDNSGPVVRDDDDDDDDPKQTLEDRIIDMHIALALMETRAGKQFDELVNLAKTIREEALAAAQKEKAEDLTLLAWLHNRILYDGIYRAGTVGAEIPPDSRRSAVAFLEQTEQLTAASKVPERLAVALRQIGRQANETRLFLAAEKNPKEPSKPANEPPAGASRKLLQVLVLATVQLAHESDPLGMADYSTQVVEAMSNHLLSSPNLERKEVRRLALSIDLVFDRAIRTTLLRPGIGMDGMDPQRTKRLDIILKRAGATGDKLQTGVEKLPNKLRSNLQRTIELAHDMRKFPPSIHKPPVWKPRGDKGPPRGKR